MGRSCCREECNRQTEHLNRYAIAARKNRRVTFVYCFNKKEDVSIVEVLEGDTLLNYYLKLALTIHILYYCS